MSYLLKDDELVISDGYDLMWMLIFIMGKFFMFFVIIFMNCQIMFF